MNALIISIELSQMKCIKIRHKLETAFVIRPCTFDADLCKRSEMQHMYFHTNIHII